MIPLMIEVNTLHEMLAQAELIKNSHYIIVDLGKYERFIAEHIPGAVHIAPADTQNTNPPLGLIPDNNALSRMLNGIGLSPDKHLIIYDDEGGGWAGRFIWILDEVGHQNYSYVNGGLSAWKGMGYATDTGDNNPPALADNLKLDYQPSGLHSITIDELSNNLGNNNLAIWDARSPKEYSGEKINAKRGGHIPGAVNFEWTDAMDTKNDLRLRTLDSLRAKLKAIGITADKDIVTHCQTHHRSGLTYLIAKLLDFPSIKAYAGSWGEWGNNEQTPIEH